MALSVSVSMVFALSQHLISDGVPRDLAGAGLGDEGHGITPHQIDTEAEMQARLFEVVIPRRLSEGPIGHGAHLLDQNAGRVCPQVLDGDPLDRDVIDIHRSWPPRLKRPCRRK